MRESPYADPENSDSGSSDNVFFVIKYCTERHTDICISQESYSNLCFSEGVRTPCQSSGSAHRVILYNCTIGQGLEVNTILSLILV